jgi:hypothetical protein
MYFKTKLNVLRKVDKYKAGLMAKAYQHVVDYNEIFTPVAIL